MEEVRIVASILWRRLDTPGHDTCRLEELEDGWQLSGAAIFRYEDGRAAQLDYRLRCDARWRSQRGEVTGWIGDELITVIIERDERVGWLYCGAAARGLEHCVDLDFGFTPATNLAQVRRLALGVGAAAEAPVAWVDLEGDRLRELKQRYERRSEAELWYTAPRFGYAELLTIRPDGFVTRYPRLWEAEAPVKISRKSK